MHRVYIGIGTNIEPRSERMLLAIESLARLGIVEKKSSIYETTPYGYTDQPDFLNSVILLRTSFELSELHDALRGLERELGRNKRQRWHEREIDFDILLYDEVIFDSTDLTVPHPEMIFRSFVLVPLNEIASELSHPVLHKTIAELLGELSFEKEGIQTVDNVK